MIGKDALVIIIIGILSYIAFILAILRSESLLVSWIILLSYAFWMMGLCMALVSTVRKRLLKTKTKYREKENDR